MGSNIRDVVRNYNLMVEARNVAASARAQLASLQAEAETNDKAAHAYAELVKLFGGDPDGPQPVDPDAEVATPARTRRTRSQSNSAETLSASQYLISRKHEGQTLQLPTRLQKGRESAATKIVAHLAAHGNTTVVDLVNAIDEARNTINVAGDRLANAGWIVKLNNVKGSDGSQKVGYSLVKGVTVVDRNAAAPNEPAAAEPASEPVQAEPVQAEPRKGKGRKAAEEQPAA